MPLRKELLLIKESLVFTWEPLFSRFGAFTPIQHEAIPVLLAGHDCLLSSRTASGKTEAATAPLVERLKGEGWKALSIIYVSPTRALVNDLFHRLEPGLNEINVSVRRRTADSPNLNVSNPPSVLITTPESLDGLMARTPRLFINVRAVVLDEIHLVDGTPRGDQVRLLLHRLRSLRRSAFENGDSPTSHLQTVALSATVSTPIDVARRYCLDPVVIKVEGKRSIHADLLPMRSQQDFQKALLTFRSRGIRKVLVFCASRVECAMLADQVRRGVKGAGGLTANPFGDSVFVHHASLSRNERLDVEARFSRGQVGICFATSTLELGVDIGDIDIVTLVGPPFNTGSFLQRIGRGNRRTNRTTLLGFYRSRREFHLFNILLRAAEDGIQDDLHYSFRPSVVIQQILSYLKQNPDGVLRPRSLRMLLDDPVTRESLMDSTAEHALMTHLLAEDILRATDRRDALTAGAKARAIYERYEENSNIDSTGRGVVIIDDFTGRVIGEIQDRDLKCDESFVLGADNLDVVRNEGRVVAVNLNNEKRPTRKLRFQSRGQALPFNLARRLAETAGIERGEMPAIEIGGQWHLIHALGNLYGHILAALLSQDFMWKSKAGAMTLISNDKPPEVVFAVEEKRLADLVRKKYKRVESLLGMGKFQSSLPEQLRQQSAERAFICSRLCRAIHGNRIVVVEDSRRVEQLSEVI